jgi:tetratricopeptide (TPR) repeat protein
MKNNQPISAYNLLMTLAENEMKKEDLKAGILLLLAAECKTLQGKDRNDELLQAAKFYEKVAKKEKPAAAKYAYFCAAKCFLRIGQYDDAMDALKKQKNMFIIS